MYYNEIAIFDNWNTVHYYISVRIVIRLSIAVVIQVLLEYKATSVRQHQLVPALLGAIAPDFAWSSHDESKISRIATGGNEGNIPPGMIEKARSCSLETVAQNLHRCLVNLLDPNSHREIIASLLFFLEGDEEILLDTRVGMKQKNEWLCTTAFEFESFLASLLVFSALYIPNTTGRRTVEWMDRKTWKKRIDRKRIKEISIAGFVPVPVEPDGFPSTYDGRSFKEVFHEIELRPTDATDPLHHLRFFVLDVRNSAFDYDGLVGILSDSLVSFAFSRARLRSSGDAVHSASWKEARRKVKDGMNAGTYKDSLGELLSYSFLEGDLKAPRLFSCVELKQKPFDVAGLDGIHIMKVVDVWQLVLGVSALGEDVCACLDEAISKISTIRAEGRFTSRSFLYSDIVSMNLPPDEMEAIREIIIPSKRSIVKPGQAYGVFLGFSCTLLASNAEELNDVLVRDALVNMISSHLPAMRELISQLGLGGCPLYFYLLPLNDAVSDPSVIMDGVLD